MYLRCAIQERSIQLKITENNRDDLARLHSRSRRTPRGRLITGVELHGFLKRVHGIDRSIETVMKEEEMESEGMQFAL